MTTSPGTQVKSLGETAEHRVRLLPPARYRHPGDVIRLIIAGLVLAGALAITAATHATYAGASAAAVTALTPPALASRVLAGVVRVEAWVRRLHAWWRGDARAAGLFADLGRVAADLAGGKERAARRRLVWAVRDAEAVR